MNILAIDIGTGTQDIILFDSTNTVENSLQMVMPSPTVIAAHRIKSVTNSRQPLILTGTNMGGGPVTGALVDHIRAGLPVHATPEAAVTFDDDLDKVSELGVNIVEQGRADTMDGAHVILRDLDINMINRALLAFDVDATWDAIAVAVFDHGNAPPDQSDRKFRFGHLREQISSDNGNIMASIYLSDEVPHYLTRMKAVANSAPANIPMVLMDTAEAAVLGSLEDQHVAEQECKVIVNIGNEHTLAFHMHGKTIYGIFEHHTHLLTTEKLEQHLLSLIRGDLDGESVWKEHGHGAIVIRGGESMKFLSVIGPMRRLLKDSWLRPYFATPHGSMMLAGTFGIIRACAKKMPSKFGGILP